MKVLVVTPMYGQAKYTNKCIEKVFENAGTTVQVLVVDDGSKEPFSYQDSRVFVHRLEKNSGFTAAANAGILWAQVRNYDAVLLLNNDTEPEKDFAKHLVDTLDKDPQVGIVASVRRHTNRPVECMELCGSDLIRGYQYFTDENKLPNDPFDCNWVALCSGLIRMSMIREIGLFDKRMLNHCSDTDYCFRAKFAGWKVQIHPKSIVLHHLSVTTTANKVLVDGDQRIMLEKIAGMDYAKLMSAMPLDGEAKTYGKLTFDVYKKD